MNMPGHFFPNKLLYIFNLSDRKTEANCWFLQRSESEGWVSGVHQAGGCVQPRARAHQCQHHHRRPSPTDSESASSAPGDIQAQHWGTFTWQGTGCVRKNWSGWVYIPPLAGSVEKLWKQLSPGSVDGNTEEAALLPHLQRPSTDCRLKSEYFTIAFPQYGKNVSANPTVL